MYYKLVMLYLSIMASMGWQFIVVTYLPILFKYYNVNKSLKQMCNLVCVNT